MTLEHYCALFSRLTRAPGRMWSGATLNRAPHKPLLLFAVMDLVARGVLTSRFISVTGELVELNELFTDYWRSIVPMTQTSSIAFPFSRLHTEPFWKLLPLPGQEITRPIINSISTVTQLRNVALGAEIDEELFVHMAGAEGRKALAAALLRACFSETGQRALREQAGIHKEAFQYSRVLEEAAHSQTAGEAVFPGEYKAAARDQGFRRAIVVHYDHRCAFCGTRIVTSEGHTAIDAAHIVPWSFSQNDDIRNGMALCKLCHWGFDEGLMGVSDAYAVIISRQVAQTHNTAGVLLNLADRNILGPQDKALWPHQDHLKWHRTMFRL
jgi:putative restriction endonuclease